MERKGRRRLTLSAHPWRRGEHRGRGHAVKERRDGRVRQAPGAMGGAAAPPPHPCPPRWHAPHDYPQLLVLAVLMRVTVAAMATAAAESAATVAETAAAPAVATVVAVAVVARRRQRACYGMVSNRSGGRRNRQQRACPHSTVSAGLACRRGATATSPLGSTATVPSILAPHDQRVQKSRAGHRRRLPFMGSYRKRRRKWRRR